MSQVLVPGLADAPDPANTDLADMLSHGRAVTLCRFVPARRAGTRGLSPGNCRT